MAPKLITSSKGSYGIYKYNSLSSHGEWSIWTIYNQWENKVTRISTPHGETYTVIKECFTLSPISGLKNKEKEKSFLPILLGDMFNRTENKCRKNWNTFEFYYTLVLDLL